jgi:hypothetical protein
VAAGSSNSSSFSDVEPGLLGFLVVAALALALVFLLRSMNKQFRKIGPAPDDAEDQVAAASEEAQSPGTAQTAADAPGSEANVRPLRARPRFSARVRPTRVTSVPATALAF